MFRSPFVTAERYMSRKKSLITYLCEPIVECSQLNIAKHSPSVFVLRQGVRAMPTSVHHKKGDVAISEIIVILTLLGGIVVGVRVIELVSLRCIVPRYSGVISQASKIVLNLRRCKLLGRVSSVHLRTS